MKKRIANMRFSEHLPLMRILQTATLFAAFFSAGYAFYHAGGGQLTIPDYFKENIFDPNESVLHETMKYRFDIFKYWVNRGFGIGAAIFTAMVVLGASLSLTLDKNAQEG